MKDPLDMDFDELVEYATLKVHSALLTGGGKNMKETMHSWMSMAILWREHQNTAKDKIKKDGYTLKSSKRQ